MTNNLEIQYNSLMTEYNMLKNELSELDVLYSEVKDEKETNKKTGSRINYVFMAAQNSSLIAIKSQRTNIISKMNDIRRNIEELKIKEFNINKNNTEEQGSSVGLIRELLLNMGKDIKQEEFINKNEDSEVKDDTYTNTEDISDFLDSAFDVNEEGIVIDKKEESSNDNEVLSEKLFNYLKEKDLEVYYHLEESSLIIVNDNNDEEVLTIVEYTNQYKPTGDVLNILESLEVKEVNELLGIVITNIGMKFQIVSSEEEEQIA